MLAHLNNKLICYANYGKWSKSWWILTQLRSYSQLVVLLHLLYMLRLTYQSVVLSTFILPARPYRTHYNHPRWSSLILRPYCRNSQASFSLQEVLQLALVRQLKLMRVTLNPRTPLKLRHGSTASQYWARRWGWLSSASPGMINCRSQIMCSPCI